MKKILFLIILFWPSLSSAQVLISEIMYNPEGTDSGREWVEFYNSGDAGVDISEYKFFENGTGHKLKLILGDTILDSDKYVVIADNSEKFLIDYPDFDGDLFDSAFSLKNTGEEIAILNDSGTEIDSFEYSADLGANGDGNSLQLNDGFFVGAEPTPGIKNTDKPLKEESNQDTETSSESSTHTGSSDISDFEPDIDFQVYAGRDRYISVNSPVELVSENNLDINRGIKYLWTMGNGDTETGYKNTYSYKNPGVYNVVLMARYKGQQSISRLKIHVTEPDVEISVIKSGKHVDIMFKNNLPSEFNLGNFLIESDQSEFEIPENTILEAGSEIIFDSDITEIQGNNIKVYFPNNDLLWESDLNQEGLDFHELIDLEKLNKINNLLQEIRQ